MAEKIYKGSLIAFVIFWTVFISLDYWQKHPFYYLSFKHFQFTNLLLILMGIGAVFVFALHFIKEKKKFLFLTNGLMLFVLSVIIGIIAVQVFLNNNGRQTLFGSYLTFAIGKLCYTAFGTYFTILVSYVMGTFISKLFPLPLKLKAQFLIDLAFGLLGVISICFVLGIFHILKWYTLLIPFLIIVGLGWKQSLAFIKKTLLKPIKMSKHFNAFGATCFYLLLVFMSMNFLQINVPFPRGWDALSLYVNIPSLIHDYNGLIQGNQPYNWSLFMAIGFVLFDSIEVTLCLSYMGGILSLAAIYYLCRDWLGMNANYSIFALLLFYTLPSVGFQCYLEQKVDLGLLFILACVLIILLNWIKVYFEPDPSKKTDVTNKYAAFIKANENKLLDPHFAAMGLLTGLAIGIKLTTLFTLFGILAAMWYVLRGKLGFLSIFSIGVFIMLLLKLDQMSGLRDYHLSASILQWTMLVIGVILLAFTFKEGKDTFMKGIRLSIIYGVFLIFPFIPWVMKNLVETNFRLDTQSILNGKPASPDASIHVYKKKYQEFKAKSGQK